MKKIFYSLKNSTKLSKLNNRSSIFCIGHNHVFYKLIFIIFIMLSILLSLGNVSLAAYPKLVNKLISAFEDIKIYIVAIATPIATVAIRFWFLNAKI